MPIDRKDSEDAERNAEGQRSYELLEKLMEDNPLAATLAQRSANEPLTPDDVEMLWNALTTRIPASERNRGIYQHLIDTAALAMHILKARPVTDVTVTEAAAMGIVRNTGMMLENNEYPRKYGLSQVVARRLHIREQARDLLFPMSIYIAPRDIGTNELLIDPTGKDIDAVIAGNAQIIDSKLSDGQRTLEMAGLLAKRDPDTGLLLSWDEVLEGHRQKHAPANKKKMLWPSSMRIKEEVDAVDLSASFSRLYVKWLEDLEGAGFKHASAATEIDSVWDASTAHDKLRLTSEALFAQLERA